MKVRYKLSNLKVQKYLQDQANLLFENYYSSATFDQNVYTSNDGRLSIGDDHVNHVYLVDAYINNKFVERKPGDGECINPEMMSRDGTAQTAPNKNMCLYTEIGNA